MKKLLMIAALLGFCAPAMVGCGSGGNKVVEPVEESDTGMTAAQQAEYEQQMKSMSSRSNSGN
jgi:hypothetical protein